MAIDATVGGASANSYLTIVAADAFAASDLGTNAKAWLAATTDEKEAALLRATFEIDSNIGRVVNPGSTTQALLFPRAEDLLADGVTWFLPIRLQRAAYLQAAYVLQNATVLDQAASFRARGLSNFSNPDGTGGQLSDDPGFGLLHPRAQALLEPLAEGSVIGIIIPT
jgi:hypothetical protein